jgi:hypothetical protein
MLWRLIILIIVVAVLLVFVGSNLDEENKCIIRFGPLETGEPVSVVLPIFASFMLGMICSVPFFIFSALKKKHKNSPKVSESAPEAEHSPRHFGRDSPSEKNEQYGID